jgi:hypothetical protein
MDQAEVIAYIFRLREEWKTTSCTPEFVIKVNNECGTSYKKEGTCRYPFLVPVVSLFVCFSFFIVLIFIRILHFPYPLGIKSLIQRNKTKTESGPSLASSEAGEELYRNKRQRNGQKKTGKTQKNKVFLFVVLSLFFNFTHHHVFVLVFVFVFVFVLVFVFVFVFIFVFVNFNS